MSGNLNLGKFFPAGILQLISRYHFNNMYKQIAYRTIVTVLEVSITRTYIRSR